MYVCGVNVITKYWIFVRLCSRIVDITYGYNITSQKRLEVDYLPNKQIITWRVKTRRFENFNIPIYIIERKKKRKKLEKEKDGSWCPLCWHIFNIIILISPTSSPRLPIVRSALLPSLSIKWSTKISWQLDCSLRIIFLLHILYSFYLIIKFLSLHTHTKKKKNEQVAVYFFFFFFNLNK